MDGTETEAELERCKLFDILYQQGPQRIAYLAMYSGFELAKVHKLIKHPWFDKWGGEVSIARKHGPKTAEERAE